MTTRTFEDKPAVRERVPLLMALVGPSGSGKTYSALRLAAGMQRVDGGEIYLVDTEARRSLHYAEKFSFRHLSFGAPFGPLDYLAAIEHCVNRGAGIVVVDSMSHEHEGPGGVLEMHTAETKRLAKAWGVKESVAQMSAWAGPKSQRRRMINTILQLPCHFIFCFRAKEKMKIVKGKDPLPQGWMPIAGAEFVYEMGVRCLLLPGARGVPEWSPQEPGEIEIVKQPDWATTDLFPPKTPLNEDTGAKLAQWAAGTVVRDVPAILEALRACTDSSALGSLKLESRNVWKGASAAQKQALKTAMDEATERVRVAIDAATPAPAGENQDSEPAGETAA